MSLRFSQNHEKSVGRASPQWGRPPCLPSMVAQAFQPMLAGRAYPTFPQVFLTTGN